MQNFLSTENKPYQVMMKIYQLVIVNLIFLISCLPIFTIGTALTTLFAVTLKMIEDKEENLLQTYVAHFKKEFKQSTSLWLIFSGSLLVFAYIYPFFSQFFQINIILFYLFILIVAISVLTSLYVFPLLAKFDNSNLGIIKSAFLLAMKHMAFSILLFFLFIFFIILIPVFFPKLLFLYLAFGFSLHAYISSFIFHSIFNKYAEI
ncbi:YesL family protein [Carnobacterium mobile]|uniref:YesL family protein n=1 Tax=Carnobacterium mobile TaxID=2750 RepID=UPI001868891B|nr:DUF624 domain-containing protein [Carnobacterium mobile]